MSLRIHELEEMVREKIEEMDRPSRSWRRYSGDCESFQRKKGTSVPAPSGSGRSLGFDNATGCVWIAGIWRVWLEIPALLGGSVTRRRQVKRGFISTTTAITGGLHTTLRYAFGSYVI